MVLKVRLICISAPTLLRAGLYEDNRKSAEIGQDGTYDILGKVSVFAAQGVARDSVRSVPPRGLQTLPSDGVDDICLDPGKFGGMFLHHCVQ